ncbi:MAG: FecR family protein [gamma proteobacterium symbiont of Taylorina sp.]|nr:FecR family protein [gamma proteobacterium symbiont of Taylorina sp.]
MLKNLFPLIISAFICILLASNTYAVSLFGLEWTDRDNAVTMEVEDSILKLSGNSSSTAGSVISDNSGTIWEVTSKFFPNEQGTMYIRMNKTRVVNEKEQRVDANIYMSDGNTIYGFIDFNDGNERTFYRETFDNFDISDYHTYSIKWTSDEKIKCFIDNVEKFSAVVPLYDSLLEDVNEIRIDGDGIAYIKDVVSNNDVIFSKTLTANVQNTTGQSFSITPTAIEVPTTSGTIPDVGAILTLKDSTTTLKRDDDSIIEVKPETIVILNPVEETTNINTLIRGEITTTVDCTNTNDYKVHTALADIKATGSCNSTQRANNTSNFTTKYSQNGVDGTLKVTVISGTVDVTDRHGKLITLTAGQETVIQDIVPRTSWVLPIDNDKLYGGKTNLFIWTEYSDANSYLLEVNLPSPVFAEENVSDTEFPKQTIILTSSAYTKHDDLIIFSLPLPKGYDATVVEMRIFSLDVTSNIIAESVSSDNTKVTITD